MKNILADIFSLERCDNINGIKLIMSDLVRRRPKEQIDSDHGYIDNRVG